MSDTPMDVSYNATVTNPTPANPSSNINPGVGMKKPQYMLNQSRPTGPGIHNKPGVRIWSGSAFAIGKSITAEITAPSIKEGDFVMGSTSEGVVHGVVEHIMTEGGVYGTPGTEYAIQSMPPENPAMAVRIYKEENGTWKPTAYSIGMMYKDAEVVDINNHSMEEESMDSELGMAMFDAQIGKADDSIMPTNTYQGKEYDGCGCPTCKELNVNCENCPVCQANEMKSDCCADLNKQAPCWDGYVQRGMKPGANGKPVPNCVPAAKAESILFAAKDYTKQTRTDRLFR